MKKFFLIFRTSFALTFSPKRMFTQGNKPASKGKSLLYGFLMLFMAGYFLAMSTALYYVLGSELNKAGAIELLIYLAVISYTAVVLLLSIFTAQGYLYKAKDLPLLLSLPVSHFTVLLSKFFLLYVFELMFSVILLVPAFSIYFHFTSLSVTGFIGAALCLLASPLIPIAIASLFSYFIALLTRRMRRKNIFTVIITLLLMTGWMIGVQSTDKLLNYILQNSKTLQDAFAKYYFPTVWVEKSLNGSLINTLLFVFMGAAVALLVFTVISGRYSDIVTILNSSSIIKRFREKSITNGKQRSAFSAILGKELSCYFGSVNYLLNTIIGPVLLLLAGITVTIMGSEKILGMVETEHMQDIGLLAAAAMTIFMPCISATTSATISLEGKKLWIYKSVPIRIRDILTAKTSVNLIINIPAILIGDLLLCIALGLNFLDYFTLITIGITYVVFCSLTGILINLAHPKLDFENETMVVKQSMSVILQMLLSMGLLFGSAITYFIVKPDNFYLFALKLILLLAVVIALLVRTLYTWGVKRFNEL